MDIKKKLGYIINDDNISLSDKLVRLQDTEQIRALMIAYFTPAVTAEEEV